MSIVLSLPYPPSTNNLFLNVKGRGRVKSEPYRRWLEEAGWALKAQRPGKIEGRVEVAISLCPPTRRKSDADNRIKATLDLLVAHGVIEADDNTVVRAIRAEWVEAQDGPCTVYVHAFPGPISSGDPDAESGDWGSARPALMEA